MSGWLILVLGMWWGIAHGAATTLEELEAYYEANTEEARTAAWIGRFKRDIEARTHKERELYDYVVEQLRKEREAPKRTLRDSYGDALILLEE